MAHAPKAPEDFSPRLQFRPQVPEKIVEVEMRVPGNRRQKYVTICLVLKNTLTDKGIRSKKVQVALHAMISYCSSVQGLLESFAFDN